MSRILTLSAAVTAVLPSVAQNARAAQPAKPGNGKVNIIHIMCDDHAYQTIGAYGYPISKLAPTPNIDRLAREGMIFTRAYVENSISTPSRATLLTGKYSHEHGQSRLGYDMFFRGQTVFPELLQGAGYQTAIVGKWHLPMDPYGFDYYKILSGQGTYYNPVFKTPDSGGKFVREDGYATTITGDDAIHWIDGRDPQKPFCLLLHYKAPHRNWMPEPKYYHLYDDVEIPVPETLFDDYATRGDAARSQEMRIEQIMSLDSDLKVWKEGDGKSPRSMGDINKEYERMTPQQQKAWMEAYGPRNERFLAANLQGSELIKWKYQQYLKDYLRCARSVDDQVGRLLDYLDANGLRENTIIVYTSDQGFYMGEHGWFDKRFMYEESFRMPLIVSFPSMIKPGAVCDELVQNIDFAPTYLDMAGVAAPEQMRGVPLRPLLEGKKPADWREDVYYHYYDYPAIHQVRRHDGVASRDYKLIHFYGKGEGKDLGNDADYFEFYDLRKDPNEIRNVYGEPKYGKQIERMKARLTQYRTDLKVEEY